MGASAISPSVGVQRDGVGASRLWRGDERHARWTGVQDQSRQRRLAEVEVVYQIAQGTGALPDIRTRVTPSVRGRVEPGVMKKVIFYELDVGVERQDLLIDIALPG